jgi:hypothetical protein
VTRRVLGRIEAMSVTARSVMDGDLSGRIAVTGTNDELDRLAENLNAQAFAVPANQGRVQTRRRTRRDMSLNGLKPPDSNSQSMRPAHATIPSLEPNVRITRISDPPLARSLYTRDARVVMPADACETIREAC